MTHQRPGTASPFRVARRVGGALNLAAGILFVLASVIGAQLRPGDGNLIWLAAGVLLLGHSAALWAIAHPDAVAGYRETALGRQLAAGDASAEAEHERLLREDDLQMIAFFEGSEAFPDDPLPLSTDGDAPEELAEWERESDDDRRWMPPEELWATEPSPPPAFAAVPEVESQPDLVVETEPEPEPQLGPQPEPVAEAAPDNVHTDPLTDDTVPLAVRRWTTAVEPAPERPLPRWAPPTSSPYPDPTVRAPVDLPAWASAARQRSARHRTGVGRRRLTG